MRKVLAQRLNDSLTDDERAEIHRVIAVIDAEIADLQERLASLGQNWGGPG